MSEPNARPNQRPNADLTGVTIAEAATILGVTSDAVRMRLKRGSLPGRKVAGRWTVLLPTPPNAAPNADPTETERPTEQPNASTVGAYAALVESQQAEIAFLREQLREREATHAEEIRRKDHLLAGFVERLPELPSGQDAPVSRPEPPGAAAGADATEEPREEPRSGFRAWWTRLWGGS